MKDRESFERHFPVIERILLQWGDMDAYAHLNNAVYFTYFESARMRYFRSTGVLDTHPVGPILASTSCRFRRALTYPDKLLVGARTTGLESDRFSMEYGVYSATHDFLAAQGEGVIVAFDYQANAKTTLPPSWRSAIEGLQEGTQVG